MKTIKFILVLSLLLLGLTACAPDPNENYIQGSWQAVEFASTGEGFFEWRFNNGAFLRKQEIDKNTMLISSGKYRILESGENLLVLELYDLKDDRFTYSNAPVEIRIEIDQVNQQISVDRVLFSRLLPG